jgi:phosphoglycolate phosphatase-like HAD superfamily hydrolase
MRLVIFDIDGTLTQTVKTDEECFLRSLVEVCGFNDIGADWSRYEHATDAGIFHEIYQSRVGRSPSPREISRFRQHFVGLLAQVSSKHLSQQSEEHLYRFHTWLIVQSIALPSLPVHGVTRRVSK